MELQQFVAETLKQIISGVTPAQEHAKAAKAQINPKDLFHRGVDEPGLVQRGTSYSTND